MQCTLIKRKPGFSGKIFWSLEIPFKTGFTVYMSGKHNLAVEANKGCKIFFHTSYYSAVLFRHVLVLLLVLFPSVLCTDCTQHAGSRFQAL